MKLRRWRRILHCIDCRRIIIGAPWGSHLLLFNMGEQLFYFSPLWWVWGFVWDHLENTLDLIDLEGFSLTKAKNMGVVEFLRGYHSECQHNLLNSFVFYVQVLAVRKQFCIVKSLVPFGLGVEKFMHWSVPFCEYGNQFILKFGKIFHLF